MRNSIAVFMIVLLIAAIGGPLFVSLGGCSGESLSKRPSEEQLEKIRQESRKQQSRQIPVPPPLPFKPPTLKDTIVDALGRMGEDAVPSLILAMKDNDAATRVEAAQALARIGPPAADAVPILTLALDDPNDMVRQAAARALGQIGPEAAAAIPALMDALHKANEEAEAKAAHSQPQPT